ncbi:MAG TPA: sugar transferase, partial [Candidatus Saccharimonadales bacterium]|nr:sugar transferase [Candidatus Saccharimonadales bacterium]
AVATGMTAGLLISAVNRSPLFFRQERAGLDNQPFSMVKLCTMDQDRRVLKMAAYLRRSGLDESPQFLQVLAGHMSAVGHRALPIADDNEIRHRMRGHGYGKDVDLWLELKPQAKPGIVGPGQTFGDRLDADSVGHMLGVIHRETDYLQTANLQTDVRLTMRAPLSFLIGHNSIIPKEGLAIPEDTDQITGLAEANLVT